MDLEGGKEKGGSLFEGGRGSVQRSKTAAILGDILRVVFRVGASQQESPDD